MFFTTVFLDACNFYHGFMCIGIYLCYICVCILVLIWYNSALYKLIIVCMYTFKHRFLLLVANCIFTTVSCKCMHFLSRFHMYKYIYICYICVCILASIMYKSTLYKLTSFYFNRDFFILVASCFYHCFM